MSGSANFEKERGEGRWKLLHACFSGTRGLLCQKLLEGINTLLRSWEEPRETFLGFLGRSRETRNLGKRKKKEVGGTKLSILLLFRILALETNTLSISEALEKLTTFFIWCTLSSGALCLYFFYIGEIFFIRVGLKICWSSVVCKALNLEQLD